MKNIVIIPARLNSQRLPNKLLEKIGNHFLIQIVYENVALSKHIDKVIIATDSPQIAEICKNLQMNFILTPDYFQSGTDRIYWAYNKLQQDYDLIINVQGDEPFLLASDLDDFIKFIINKEFDVATIITRMNNFEDVSNTNIVKVVVNSKHEAMYFSRSVIPYNRDGLNSINLTADLYYKHIGVYAYKPHSLKIFSELPQSHYEKLEKLEQLRLLSAGYKYLCYEIAKDLVSIDTTEDLEKARQLFANKS